MLRAVFVLFAMSLGLLMGLSSPVQAQPVMSGVRVEATPGGGEQLTFIANVPIVPGKVFTLANPDRLVIDMPHMQARGIGLPKAYKGALVKAVRFGQFDPATSRIVVDLSGPVTVVQTVPGKKLVVEIAPVGAATVPPPASGRGSRSAAGNQSTPALTPEDKKPLVMIDAGHGGQDPGAIGLHENHEKDVTLAFALALREALLRTGRYRVGMTREDDHFVMLTDRVAMARKIGANLFISFHADSNPRPEARGLSIYTLSETASDDESAALAERENKADIIPGIDLNTTDADVANILIDLTQRETMNKSARLADAIVAKLNPKINRLPKTHRFAGFRVLKAPDIPSTLIELGFLSNAVDERLLLTPEYRDLVVASVVKGVDRYWAVK
jgi:N-acetylmuramoyl-L-alanine amidase